MGLKKYLEKHNTTREILYFIIIGQLALFLQIVSRLGLDYLLKNITYRINIKPFKSQALGSFIAFSVSCLAAKTLSYILNLKNFRSKNSYKSLIIYTFMTVVFIVFESVIGTPFQNVLYRLFKGSWTGEISTSTVNNVSLYQLSGSLSIIVTGLVDSVITFIMDKFVIMKPSDKVQKKKICN